MPIDELLRLNKFELFLMLLQEWDEMEPVRRRLSDVPSWDQAISNPQSLPAMQWLDFNEFRRQVLLRVGRALREKYKTALDLHRIICTEFDYCAKTSLPVGMLLAGIAKALSDMLPENVANVIAVLLFSHDILQHLCHCNLLPSPDP